MLDNIEYIKRIQASQITKPIRVTVIHKSSQYYMILYKGKVFNIEIPTMYERKELSIGNELILYQDEYTDRRGYIKPAFNFEVTKD